jgi:hypothetical protein
VDYDSLVVDVHTIVCLCGDGDTIGVVFCSVEMALEGVGEWTAVQGLVRFPFTKFSIGRMVPWKHHIKHANESPLVEVANIADRDIVYRFGRVRIPQRKPETEGCELVLVNVEGWIY